MSAQIPPGNGDAHPTPPAEGELARFSIVLRGKQVSVENFPMDPVLGRAMLLDAMFVMESFYRQQGQARIVVPGIVVPPGL